MDTILILSGKGGAGKTTIARELAVAGVLAGRSVALADLDPQVGLTGWYGRRSQETPLLVALPPNEDLAELANAGIDELIIDLPPGMPFAVARLVVQADVVLGADSVVNTPSATLGNVPGIRNVLHKKQSTEGVSMSRRSAKAAVSTMSDLCLSPVLRGMAGACLFMAMQTLGPQDAQATVFHQTNLVTDDQAALAAEGFAPAAFVDPNLINPWGVSFPATGPFWVSNQGSATATLYTGAGAPFPLATPLVVSIPQNPAPPAGPTGQVNNSTTGFQLSTGGKTGAAAFIFANLDGSISAWNGTGTPTQAVQVVPPSTIARPAVYTGITIGQPGGQPTLYVANNLTGKVDVFDQNFHPISLPGTFTDPGAPAGFAPFNVQNIGGQIFVTYATPGPSADNAPLGSGFVSVFDANGNFVRRFTTGGPLASPWGLALAPSSFGQFSNDLLIGNFNDENGNINAFDPATGNFLGSVLLEDGTLVSLPDLWSISFGNGATAGPLNTLFFTAGIGDELHGLFGSLTPAPEPASLGIFGGALALLAAVRRRRRPV